MATKKRPSADRKISPVKRIRTDDYGEDSSHKKSPGTQPRIVVVEQKTSTAVIISLVIIVLLSVVVAAFLLINRLAPNSETSTGSTQPVPTVEMVPASWSEIGTIKGEIQSIAFDPSNSKTQLLGTGGAGLQISLDGGKEWKASGLNSDTILDMSVNPKDSSHIVAATVEAFMETKDGGKTWAKATGLPDGQYHSAQFDPRNPKVMWAALWKSDPTLYVSTDGGNIWKPVSGGPQQADINFVSFDERTKLTYVGSYGEGLWSTSDNGKSWQESNNGLPTNTDITMIALSSDPKVLFVGTHDYGVFRSQDGGDSWEAANAGKEQANDVHGLVVHPKDPDTVYAAGMMMGKGVFVSKDRGTTWQPLETGSINLDDVHVFVSSPDKKSIIMGSGEHGGEPLGTLYRTSF